MKKSRILLYITSILSLVGTLILYPGLPEQIPVHYNYNWEVDGYGVKQVALLIGVFPLAMCILMDILPVIDPKKKNLQKSERVYDIFRYLLVFLFLFVNWITLLIAKGVNMNAKVVMALIMGIVFVGLGNYMPKVKPNYFLGIKTPWTLANDVSWRKTHRVGGYIFILYGILCLMSGLIPNQMFGYFLMVVLLGGVVFLYVYSYLVYRKEAEIKAEKREERKGRNKRR